MPRYRKKPLAQLEHGTRIYAPSTGEAGFRVVATDPVSGERIFAKCRTKDAVPAKAASSNCSSPRPRPSAIPNDAGPGRCNGCLPATSRTTCRACGCGSVRSRPNCWDAGCCHASDRTVTAWTPADSAAAIATVRRAGGPDALTGGEPSARRRTTVRRKSATPDQQAGASGPCFAP
jgi:hypothetical protein